MADQTFTARQLPWAKIGTIIDDPDVDARQAAKLGGLDFDVDSETLGYFDSVTKKWVEIPTRRAIVHHDDRRWMSVVSTDYTVVQYGAAFDFLDQINPRYVAAGTLSDGKQGFLVIQLPGHESLAYAPGGEADPHQLYVLVRTSHDLSKSVEVAVLTLRDRCMNQLTLPSLVTDAPQRWTVRHVGNPQAKLREAQRVLAGAPRYAEVLDRRIQQLTSVNVTPQRLRVVLKHVLRNSLARKEDMIDRILEMAKRPTVGFEGTGWGAVNTVSEYFQWGRPTATRTEQSIFTDSFDGDGAKYTNRVATALLANA
jgi:phage/plasmid-like protein (TIGR03299 family)